MCTPTELESSPRECFSRFLLLSTSSLEGKAENHRSFNFREAMKPSRSEHSWFAVLSAYVEACSMCPLCVHFFHFKCALNEDWWGRTSLVYDLACFFSSAEPLEYSCTPKYCGKGMRRPREFGVERNVRGLLSDTAIRAGLGLFVA